MENIGLVVAVMKNIQLCRSLALCSSQEWWVSRAEAMESDEWLLVGKWNGVVTDYFQRKLLLAVPWRVVRSRVVSVLFLQQ